MSSLNPYLSFKNDARPAMEFYRSVFGGDLEISTFGSFEGMVDYPSEQDLVMHAQEQLFARNLGSGDGHCEIGQMVLPRAQEGPFDRSHGDVGRAGDGGRGGRWCEGWKMVRGVGDGAGWGGGGEGWEMVRGAGGA